MINKSDEYDEAYTYGMYHKAIGIAPKYDHMKGSRYYDYYMSGFNTINDVIREVALKKYIMALLA